MDSYRLAEGILLEKAGILLPWASDIRLLERLGSPEVFGSWSDQTLVWRDESILGGIRGDISLSNGHGHGPRVFSIDPPAGSEGFADAHAEFEHYRIHLEVAFGAPDSSENIDGYPWLRWYFGPVRVSLRIGERFTEYASFMISYGT